MLQNLRPEVGRANSSSQGVELDARQVQGCGLDATSQPRISV